MILQAILRRDTLLNTKLPWAPPSPSYHDQAFLKQMTKINMRELTSSISSYHYVYYLKLPWVVQLKFLWDSKSQATMSISTQAISGYPWDLPSQDIMRSSISRYHEITSKDTMPWPCLTKSITQEVIIQSIFKLI